MSVPIRSQHQPDTGFGCGAAERPDRRPAFVIFIGSLLVYAATAARETVSADVWTAYVAANRILDVGRPRLDATGVPGWNDSPYLPVWVRTSSDGYEVIGRAPGVIAAALPGYWMSGGTTPTMLPGALTAALITALAMTLFYLCIRTYLSLTHALVCTVALGFTTPVWSISADGIWPHTLTALGLAGMAWAASHERWWVVGLFASVAMWGRIHIAVIAAVLGLIVGLSRRRPDITVKIGLVTATSVVLMSVWSRWMYGSWSPTAGYVVADFLDTAATKKFDVMNHLGFWISPGFGVFVWTPVLLLLLPSLVRRWKDLPDWSRALAVGGLVYTVMQLTLNRFSGGVMFWGYRYGLELLVACAPALAVASAAMTPRLRRLVGPVLGLQLCVILPGAIYERGFNVPQGIAWTRNSFVEVLVRIPVLMLSLILFCVLLGALTQLVLERRVARPVRED